MATISEALAIAVQLHQAGRLEMAEDVCRRILSVEPNEPDALHLHGLIAHQAGQHDIAIERIEQAIRSNGAEAAFHNSLGEAYRALSRASEAIACYGLALKLQPDFVEAHFNLGNVLRNQGRLDEAAACYRRALELKPAFAGACNNLGSVFQGQGRLDEAVACFRRATELQPDFAGAHNNLGLALQARGTLDEAIVCYRRALELQPDFVAALYNLGNAFRDQGRLDEAVACYRRALGLRPEFVAAYYNLGNVLRDQGKLDEAIACYQRTIEIEPDHADAHNNLGATFEAQGKLIAAIACYRRATELQPDFATAHYNLGLAFKEHGKLEEAVGCFRRALELQSDFAEAHNSMGDALKDQGRLQDAIACCRRALEIKPDFAGGYNNLGIVLHAQGKLDEAVACHRRALEIQPDYAAAHSNLLCTRQYQDGVTLADLADAHREFEQRHAAPLRSNWSVHANVRDPDRRLRLGFLSPDFGRHPVGFFLIRALESLDRQRCETICYHDRFRRDDLTARFQAAAATWRDVYSLTDEQLAQQIRADRIDILFDLAGHTARNRLLVFARKPAPIQITWIGYEGTTGLSAMDYLIADRRMIPAGSEPYYREQILHMPDVYICFAPPADAPAVGPLPAATNGHVAFGSFNNPAKIGPHVVEVWADILRRVAQSRLVMKYRGLGDETARQRYLQLFTAHGVEPQQLVLLPSSPYSEYLASYQHIDIALDPFPFSGGLTTCEALWMGVPMITWPGETFASRHSLTHLRNVELAEQFVARGCTQYVDLAMRWANDLDRLAAVRAGLRGRMAASPLCDGQRFAANLLVLLRGVWRKWVAGA